MSKTGVSVKLQDSQLGTFQPKVGNCMLFYGKSSGTASTAPKLVTSVDAFNAWAAGDAPKGIKDDAFLKAEVETFYKNAPTGTYLWICVVKATDSDFVTSNADAIKAAIRATGEADFDNRPRIVGFVSDVKGTVSSTAIVPSSLLTMVQSIDTIYDALFIESFRFTSVVASDIDASSMLDDAATKAPDCSKYNAPAVGVTFTTDVYTTTTDAYGAIVSYTTQKDVCEIMGILSAISLGQSIGSCARPAVATTAFFNGGASAVPVTSCVLADYDAMGDKQMIFHRIRPGRGIFYNDGATCNDAVNALSKLEYSRLGNAVCDDAEYFFTGILNTQAPVEANGDLSKLYATQIKNAFYNQYCLPRITQGQCSAISVEVGAKNNDFVGTKTIEVTISIQPSPNIEQVIVYVMYVKSVA